MITQIWESRPRARAGSFVVPAEKDVNRLVIQLVRIAIDGIDDQFVDLRARERQ